MTAELLRRTSLVRVLALALGLVLGRVAAMAQLLGGGAMTVLPAPQNGKTIAGATFVGGTLRDGPCEDITTIVKCFGTIRYNFIPARLSLLGVTMDTDFGTDLFPQTAGNHTATLSVYVKGSAKPLSEMQVSFTIAKPESVEGPTVDSLRDELAGLSSSVEYAEKAYARASQDGKSPDRAKKLADAADSLHRSRVEDFFGRIRGCVRMAAAYERALDPEQSLRSLQLAQEIYEGERETACVNPRTNANSLNIAGKPNSAPAFMDGFARHYTRLGDLENAVAWRLKIAAWYEQQAQRADLDAAARKGCRNSVAVEYRAVAAIHILLKNNLDEAKVWQDKAAKAE